MEIVREFVMLMSAVFVLLILYDTVFTGVRVLGELFCYSICFEHISDV